MPVYEEKGLVNGQKRWFIRTYVTDEYGNRKQVTRHNKEWIGREGKKEAECEEAMISKSLPKMQLEKKRKSITLSEGLNKYLNSLKLDCDTIISKRIKLDLFCSIDKTQQVKTYPDKLISLFTKNDYMLWQKQIKEKKYFRGKDNFGKKIQHSYSIDYLNKVHGEICNMFKFFTLEGYCDNNVIEQVGKIGTPKEIKMCKRKKNYQVLDYGEYLKLMDVTKNDLKFNTMFDLWFSRGPRLGEIRAFRVVDFNYEKKQLMVNHTLNKKNELKDPKTASSKAPIDLDDELNEKIKCLINNLEKETNFTNEWYLFNSNTPISEHSINYNIGKYLKKAQINKHIKSHELRHSCATWLFSIGIPITVISKILRHKDIYVTMSTYIHLLNKEYLDQISIINSIKQDQKKD